MTESYFNTGTSIPYISGKVIKVTAAISGFTANGVNIPTSITNPLYLDNAPLLVTGSITNVAAGTIFYYYDRGNNSDLYN
jgi:hypothetical protein